MFKRYLSSACKNRWINSTVNNLTLVVQRKQRLLMRKLAADRKALQQLQWWPVVIVNSVSALGDHSHLLTLPLSFLLKASCTLQNANEPATLQTSPCTVVALERTAEEVIVHAKYLPWYCCLNLLTPVFFFSTFCSPWAVQKFNFKEKFPGEHTKHLSRTFSFQPWRISPNNLSRVTHTIGFQGCLLFGVNFDTSSLLVWPRKQYVNFEQ